MLHSICILKIGAGKAVLFLWV